MSRIKKLNRLLPLVAIGTIADCQSILQPTNRILAKAGISVLQQNKHAIDGLEQLVLQTSIMDKIYQGYKITSQDLAYIFSPILNSSGRISHARLSISTLLVDNNHITKPNLVEENNIFFEQSPAELAKQLIDTNSDRKQMVKDILEEVELEAENQYKQGKELLWLSGPWSKGIIGLLASRLVNKYDLPVVVVSTLAKDDSLDH